VRKKPELQEGLPSLRKSDKIYVGEISVECATDVVAALQYFEPELKAGKELLDNLREMGIKV
jgi:hypothetical protein